jgi:hypothetical protein
MIDKHKHYKSSKKGTARIFVSVAIIMVLVALVLTVHIWANTEIVEKPCVDGDGDVNLEGIMCEKEVYNGNPIVRVLVLIMLVLSFFFILYALTY